MDSAQTVEVSVGSSSDSSNLTFVNEHPIRSYDPKKPKRHQVKTACLYCQTRKIKCGADRPCARCIGIGLECVDRPAKGATPDVATLNAIEKVKERFKRAPKASKDVVKEKKPSRASRGATKASRWRIPPVNMSEPPPSTSSTSTLSWTSAADLPMFEVSPQERAQRASASSFSKLGRLPEPSLDVESEEELDSFPGPPPIPRSQETAARFRMIQPAYIPNGSISRSSSHISRSPDPDDNSRSLRLPPIESFDRGSLSSSGPPSMSVPDSVSDDRMDDDEEDHDDEHSHDSLSHPTSDIRGGT
ncbi:hypothetical protein DL96DRAFT_62258 [Flagelloscypha sp. PMI_526]|nr:hypothetical protein DL96DRAFT_62258 [Flagelloscypha sp. PMI_526]